MQVKINGQVRDVDQGISIEGLLAEMQLNPRHVAVEVNMQLVPRGEHTDYRLSEADQLEIVTLAGGG